MCGKFSRKFFAFVCVILVASSGLWAFGWDRSRTAAPATAVTTPTAIAAPASAAPEPAAYLAPSSEVAPDPQELPQIQAIAESKSSASNPSVESALTIMNELLSELESSKKASKEAQATLTGLQSALSNANASFEAYKLEAARVMEEKQALAHELNRIHLGLGLGASYSPLEDLANFGTEIDLSLRKGSFMLLAGIEYPDMMNVLDFDYTKLKVKGSVIYEF